jgi:hypothetical protein
MTTVMMSWVINGALPDRKLSFSLLLTAVGAFLAGYETFDKEWFGYFLVWMNNLSQSCYNVYVNKVNKEKKVSPFGKPNNLRRSFFI